MSFCLSLPLSLSCLSRNGEPWARDDGSCAALAVCACSTSLYTRASDFARGTLQKEEEGKNVERETERESERSPKNVSRKSSRVRVYVYAHSVCSAAVVPATCDTAVQKRERA